MIEPGDEPFSAPASNQLLFPSFDDPVGWDSTTNDAFVQTLMGTLPSGSQVGLNLAVYPDLSANCDVNGCVGTEDAPEGSAGRGGDLGLTLSYGHQLDDAKRKVLLGNGSRHGSNDKLAGEDNDSPRGSSKSQQTLVGLRHGRVEEPGREALWRVESMGLKARNANAPHSPRPVRKRSLPKRLADSNMATQLPAAVTALRHAGAGAARQQADNIPAWHSQTHLQILSGDQVSSGPTSTLGTSAQSQNNPGAVLSTKRKQDVMSEIVDCGKHHCGEIAATTRNESRARARPSFADLVRQGVMRPGEHTFCIGQAPVVAEVCEDGTILYLGTRFRAVSKFAFTVLRARNPARQSCDGWKEMSWNGEKLDKIRDRMRLM